MIITIRMMGMMMRVLPIRDDEREGKRKEGKREMRKERMREKEKRGKRERERGPKRDCSHCIWQ